MNFGLFNPLTCGEPSRTKWPTRGGLGWVAHFNSSNYMRFYTTGNDRFTIQSVLNLSQHKLKTNPLIFPTQEYGNISLPKFGFFKNY